MKSEKTSVLITLSILLILVVASPAQAEISVVDPPDGYEYNVSLGDAFEFDITMENVDNLDSFEVIIKRTNLNNPVESVTCEFDRHGNNLKKDHGNEDECKGIKIMKPGHEYGYGSGYSYGYGYGYNYKYRVRIETSKGFINDHYDYEESETQYTIILNVDDDGTLFYLTVTEPKNNGKAKGKK